jgi:hypothetical protein
MSPSPRSKSARRAPSSISAHDCILSTRPSVTGRLRGSAVTNPRCPLRRVFAGGHVRRSTWWRGGRRNPSRIQSSHVPCSPNHRSVAMPVTVVVGAQWGDEGKAKVIDLLSKEHGYVVRYQGGHNAGHTVVVGGEKLRAAAHPERRAVRPRRCPSSPTAWWSTCPRCSTRSTRSSRARHLVRARSVVEPPCPPDLPLAPGVGRAGRGKVRGDAKIGTTLKGIGPAYADKARRVGVRAGEVARPRPRSPPTVKVRAAHREPRPW